MSLRLVYVGAAAGLAPAASLRALAGGGAVFVTAGLDDELHDLVAQAAGHGEARPAEIDALDEDALADLVARAREGDVTVALAGAQGPELARALRARASADPAAGPASTGPASPAAAPPAVPVLTVPDGPAFDDALLGQELVSLKRIVDVLRVECPWDREQTARDIVSYTVEEVFELADAVAGDDLEAEHGELGDLLLQVVILAMMLAERDAGDLGSVAHAIEVKLIRRHPHIFADAVAETGAEVRARWERIKVEQEGREGIFHDVPAGAPALHYARKLQQRAAAVGFDWDSASAAFHKIAEEHAELAEVLLGAAPQAADQPDKARLTHEFGDLLFAVVNVARLAKVDPELALREAARRFALRVCTAATIAEREGRDWTALGLDEQERYYRQAKSQEGSS